MLNIKVAVIKMITAISLSFVIASTTVAFAASGSVNQVKITDGDKEIEIKTYCNTASEILSDANIKLLSGDTVDFNLEAGKGNISITRSFPVHITTGKETTMLKFTGGTVATALKKAGITLGKYDICNYKPDDVLTSETYIDIVGVEYNTVSYEETLPFTTEVKYSASLKKGTTKVTGGVEGVKTVTLKQKVVNGKVVESDVVSSVVTKKAVNKVKTIGTKVIKTSSSKKTVSALKPSNPIELDKNGKPVKYKKAMTFRASAYSGGGICSTGKKAQTGYIAVNPKIIPYGTKMYIVSNDGRYVYGYAVAADTGGFARRNPYMVDLYFNTKGECTKFGIRNVTIYFL